MMSDIAKDVAKDVTRQVSDKVQETVREKAAGTLQASIDEGAKRVEGVITNRLNEMVGMVVSSAEETLDEQFVGIDEEDILTFIPDERQFAGIGPALLGLFFLVLFPSIPIISVPFFLVGAAAFVLRYVNNAKVDVPDGYEGVVCHHGKPDPNRPPQRGRNWLLTYANFIPYLVSQRDQVVDMTNANFTGDYASIGLSNQIVFRVVDSAKFVENTSPAGIMKSLNLYASYIALRIITSVKDARVKFSGRDSLDNVSEALNGYLSEDYGIEVVSVSMPSARNKLLEDLEEIRTLLKEIDSMKETRQVRLESAIKAVESQLRTKRKETRSRALELQQAKISLDTDVSEHVNTKRQEVLISARRQLEEMVSDLRRRIANFKARWRKARAIRDSFEGLERNLGLREAALKRNIFQKLIPRRVSVFSVEGIGTGIGMGLSRDVVKRILEQGDAAGGDGSPE